MTAPPQTLYMDVWGPARVSGQGRERYFLLVVDDYTRYTTVFLLRSKGEVSAVLIPWIRTFRLQLSERFGQDLPVLRLHFDRGGEFSSDLLREFCRGEGINQSFTILHSPQQNGIAELMRLLPIFYGRLRSVLPPHLAPCPPVSRRHARRGSAPSGVSQVDPLPGLAPVKVAVASGASPGASSGGAASGGAGSEGAGSRVAEPEGVDPRGGESEGAEPGGAESEGAESRGAEPRGAASSGGPANASPRLSSHQLREWLFQRAHRQSGAPGAGEPRDAGAGGAALELEALALKALELQELELLTLEMESQPPLKPASPLLLPSLYTEQSGGLTERREPPSRPVLPVRTARRAPRLCPPPVPGTHTMALRPSFVPLRVPLLAPPESSLHEVPDPEFDRARAASPTVARLLATAVTDPSFESAAASALVAELLDFAAVCRLDYASAVVSESVPASPPSVGGECALGTDVLEDRQEEFKCLAGAAAMDAEMASWKSTGTYVDEVPPPGVNIVDGMWIFRVKRPPGSPPAFKACYAARGFGQRQGVDYFQTFSPTPKMTTLWVLLHVAAQRDYELHSLDFSTVFLHGSLHEEIWLRRPPSFTGSFPAGTQWSLRRPVYGLLQVPREWHDTLRTTLAALGFVPSTADLSLFLRTDTLLPPFYVLVYVDDLVFATADTEALTLVKLEQRTKHIALRYFLARELQQRGQLHLAYVATRANIADVFTKALPPGDHQRFVTVLGLLALLCFFS
ncbi:unnamed protein product [Closterium sp. NIES-53]